MKMEKKTRAEDKPQEAGPVVFFFSLVFLSFALNVQESDFTGNANECRETRLLTIFFVVSFLFFYSPSLQITVRFIITI